jgi:hypothetical protein
MADCELIEICPFFNDYLENMPAASDTMKKLYCRWHHSKCGRYKVAIVLGRKNVPLDLFPGDSRRAEEILMQHNKK